LNGKGNHNRNIYITSILIIGFSLILNLISGCSENKIEKGAFYTAGTWDIPPAYHGNPWAPGGVGVAGAYVHEPLFVYIPPSEEYINRLGESFTESPDHRTLTVRLKKGVTWHDGEKFTSRDVKTTFEIGYLKGIEIWMNLDKIQCPDDYTVVFKWHTISPTNTIRALTEPINSPYHIFGEWAEKAPGIRKKRIDLFNQGILNSPELSKEEQEVREVLYKYHPELPIGTGAFKIGKVTSSDMLLLKYPQYYEADNVKFDKIRIMRWVSNEIVWSYLIAGEVDVVSPACPYDVVQQILKKNPGMSVITPSDLNDFGLIFNCTKAPMSDLRFRRAIAHILDRDMIRQVAYTYGTTMDDYSIGLPTSVRNKWIDDSFLKQLTLYDRSFEKAEKLLTEAGFRRSGNNSEPRKNRWINQDGSELSLEITAPAGLNDLILLADVSSAQLTRFGIKTQVRVVPMEIYSQRIRERNFDIAAENGSQLNKYGHPSVAYNRFYMKGSLMQMASGLPETQNYMGKTINTRLLTDELNKIVDEKRTREIVKQLAYVTNENLPYLACYEKRFMIFVQNGKRVQGWLPADSPIWGAAPGGIENLYSTMIVKGMIKPVE
jgi:peptide/nickel transport system substrate-binding protein